MAGRLLAAAGSPLTMVRRVGRANEGARPANSSPAAGAALNDERHPDESPQILWVIEIQRHPGDDGDVVGEP